MSSKLINRACFCMILLHFQLAPLRLHRHVRTYWEALSKALLAKLQDAKTKANENTISDSFTSVLNPCVTEIFTLALPLVFAVP